MKKKNTHVNVYKLKLNLYFFNFFFLGNGLNLSDEDFKDFDIIFKKVKNIVRNKVHIIWIATNWSLWIMRNTMIFDNISFSFDTVCSNVLYLY